VRTWAFVSQKGGSGKSTLATQLSVCAEQHGENVCLIDLDAQRSALAWSEARGKREPNVVPGLPEKLRDMVDQAGQYGITMCMVDTAPHTDTDALAAIRVADLIICPTQPSLFDVVALKDTADLLHNARRLDRAIGVVNGLPHQGTEAAYGEAEVAVKSLGLNVAKAFVCHRRPFVIAIGQGSGVTESHKRDMAAKEITRLWNELNALMPAPAKVTKATKERVSP
jgi:chromosome partitioning protein